MGVLMLLAAVSFLAWMPAIAAVVDSRRGTYPKLLLLLMLAAFPPAALGVMVMAVKNADEDEDQPKRPRRKRNASRCRDRYGLPARLAPAKAARAAVGA